MLIIYTGRGSLEITPIQPVLQCPGSIVKNWAVNQITPALTEGTTTPIDDLVDALYDQIYRELLVFMMEDPRSIPRILDVIWSARALERIGDRCCNICEYIIYFVEGKDVRHTSLEKMVSSTRQKPG